jgi:hypothetical protein
MRTQGISHRSKPEEKLYLYSMGKRLRVTAIFTDVQDANRYMEGKDEGVIAELGPFIFLANLYDPGEAR